MISVGLQSSEYKWYKCSRQSENSLGSILIVEKVLCYERIGIKKRIEKI